MCAWCVCVWGGVTGQQQFVCVRAWWVCVCVGGFSGQQQFVCVRGVCVCGGGGSQASSRRSAILRQEQLQEKPMGHKQKYVLVGGGEGFSGQQQEEREGAAIEANGAQPMPALEVRREGGSGCLWLPGLWCRAAHVRSQECTALLTTHD